MTTPTVLSIASCTELSTYYVVHLKLNNVMCPLYLKTSFKRERERLLTSQTRIKATSNTFVRGTEPQPSPGDRLFAGDTSALASITASAWASKERSQCVLSFLRPKEVKCGPQQYVVYFLCFLSHFLWRVDQQATRVINVFVCLSLGPWIRWLA